MSQTPSVLSSNKRHADEASPCTKPNCLNTDQVRPCGGDTGPLYCQKHCRANTDDSVEACDAHATLKRHKADLARADSGASLATIGASQPSPPAPAPDSPSSPGIPATPRSKVKPDSVMVEPTANRATDFFEKIIDLGRLGSIKPSPSFDIIVVVHVLPTLQGFLNGLKRLGDVKVIILKGTTESRDRDM